MCDKTMESRVLAGVALLDDKVPNWRDLVNKRFFDINDPRQCVLGQVFGRYCTGINKLGITFRDAKEYGFVTCYCDSSHTFLADYRRLTNTWLQVL